MKKLFVISDIHGHYCLLKKALDKAGFDPKNPDHLLVGCGDYFDRGRENREVLQYLERVENKVLLRGNHEDLLLKLFNTGRFLPHNYINGTLVTLENLFGKYVIEPEGDRVDFSGQTRMVDRVCGFMEDMVQYFETEHYVFVHGWLPQYVSCRVATENDWEEARWVKWTQRYNGCPPLKDKILVCGHVPTFFTTKFDGRSADNADIFYGNGLIAVDAGTFDSRQVNVLVLEDNLLS